MQFTVVVANRIIPGTPKHGDANMERRSLSATRGLKVWERGVEYESWSLRLRKRLTA